jgi:ribA/ribD-fused uncharacterized protein
MDTISVFKGDYEFLSNFFKLRIPIQHDGVSYPTVEHFYQAMKSLSPEKRRTIACIPYAGAAKKYGRSIYLRTDWESIKIPIMRLGLTLKFAGNPELKVQLLNTLTYILVEGNYWHDNIWGNCLCPKCANTQGQNLLGYLLMEIRELFRSIK